MPKALGLKSSYGREYVLYSTMVAAQRVINLENILEPDNILDKNREFVVFNGSKEQDLVLLQELLLDSPSAERESQIMTAITSCFGKMANNYPSVIGTSETLQAVVQTNHKFNLRFKGINRLSEVRKNLKHALFLASHNELGYSATIGVGPSIADPMYLVMINAPKNGVQALSDELSEGTTLRSDVDPLPKTLNSILDFIASYSLVKSHIGPVDYIQSHLDLVNIKLASKLDRSSKLTAGQKELWKGKINNAINNMKLYIVPADKSTWVLTDTILENFVNIGNGVTEHRDHWLVIDQGYSDKQYNKWIAEHNYSSEVALERAFYGRVEYNIGQLFYSIEMDASIADSVKDKLADRINIMITQGVFNKGTNTGQGKARIGKPMPEPHNTRLSLSYYNLGALVIAVSDLLVRLGENEEAVAYVDKLLYRVADGSYTRIGRPIHKFN